MTPNGNVRVAYLGDVSSDNGNFSEHIEKVVEPSWQVSTTCRCQIKARDGAQLDGKALEEDGKDVAEQDDEEELEAVRRACRNVGRVVARIDYAKISG